MTNKKPILLLIDGHSLAFRSFYAFSKGGEGGLSTKEGIPPSVTLSHKVSSFLDIHHRAPPRSRHIKLEERKKQLGGFRVKLEICKLLEICGNN